MTQLKEKSKFNFDAADLLIKGSLYAPSVHCSYYGCFQLMKFIIKDFFGKTYNQLNSDIAVSRKNTHKYIIDYIAKEIRDNASLVEFRNFSNTINDLKRFREQSDYEDIEIDFDLSAKALNKAKEIQQQLKNNFHI